MWPFRIQPMAWAKKALEVISTANCFLTNLPAREDTLRRQLCESCGAVQGNRTSHPALSIVTMATLIGRNDP